MIKIKANGNINELISQRNEMDFKTVQVWGCIVEDDLKIWISTTYTNKVQLLFGSAQLKNSK